MSQTKVLFIGYLREPSGWGQAARDRVLALDAAGFDVVARCFYLRNDKVELPESIKQLESKDSSGCEICIQYLLPHHMEFDGNFRNVAMFECETSHFLASCWADQLNNFDDVIVPCEDSKRSAERSGVTVPVHVIPHATDITRFEQGYPTLEMLKPVKEGGFIFYAIGEWVRRKNFSSLLRAFHTEFDPDENVELVIKTSRPGLLPADAKRFVEQACTEVKSALRLHGGNLAAFKREHVITERLSETAMMKLHATGDCFVLPSHGEAWCIPAFDAMAMGKTPIVSDAGGFREYLRSGGGWLVPTISSQVFGVDDSFGDLFTGREEWKDVEQAQLRACMRKAFTDSQEKATRSELGREAAYNFTYSEVGNKLRVLLHG